MVLGSLTLGPSIYYTQVCDYNDTICSPLVVHYLDLPAELMRAITDCITYSYAIGEDMPYTTPVLNALRAILDSSPEEAYVDALMVRHADGLMAAISHLLTRDDFMAQGPSLRSLSAADICAVYYEAAVQHCTNQFRILFLRWTPYSYDKELMEFKTLLLLNWCDASIDNYKVLVGSNIWESLLPPSNTQNCYKNSPKDMPLLTTAHFDAVVPLFRWMGSGMVIEKFPSLVGEITRVLGTHQTKQRKPVELGFNFFSLQSSKNA